MRERGKPSFGQNVLHYVIICNLVVLILILVTGVFLYRFNNDRMREVFYKNNQQYLDHMAGTHENEIQIMKNIAMQIELSDSARFLMAEQPTKISALKKQLYQYRSVNQFFDVMYFYYQKDSYLYNHATSMKVPFFCETAYLFSDISSRDLETLLSEEFRTIRVIPEQQMTGALLHFYDTDDTNAIYIVPCPPSYDSILLFFVGEPHFTTLLEDNPENRRNSYLIHDGEIVAQRGNCEIDTSKLLEQMKQLNTMDEQLEVKLSGDRYLLSAASDTDGFVYLVLQDMTVFTNSFLSNIWGMAVLLFLCWTVSVLLILIHSRHMLGGVRNINHLLNDDTESPYALGNIERGIQNLVNRSESMKEEQKTLHKTSFVRDFVCSDYTAKEILRRDAEAAQIDISGGTYMVGIIGTHQTGSEQKAFEQILEYICSNLEVDGYGIRLINNAQSVMVLFASGEDPLYQAYSEILNIGTRVCGTFVVAVSWYHKSLLIGSSAYLEANTAYDSRFLVDNGQIIRFTELGQNEALTSYRDLRSRYMVQLENTIRVGNEEDVEKEIRKVCEKLQEEGASLLTFRLLYDEVLRFLMAQWKGEEKDWNQIYNVFTLSRCLTMEDFYSLLSDVCHMLLNTRSNAGEWQSELVKSAIKRMQQEYSSPELSMSFLAESLGVSPVTFAVEFKNETGISPSDYLSVVRLDHAKQLLRTSDMLVREISNAIGYEDEHVFIRRFKKYTGMTPGQYRRDIRAEV